MMYEAVDELMAIMEKDRQWHTELAAVLENKLDAMQHYDLSRLEALALQEQRLVAAITGNEKQRQVAIRRATLEHLPLLKDRVAAASELAQVLDDERREKLLLLVALLREITEKVKRLNRINAMATRKILGHVDYMFQVLAQSGRDIGLYGRGGKKTMLEQNRLIDAVV